MPEQYDLIIRNATIVDGTGKPGIHGSIAVKGEKIAAVGKVSGTAMTVIDGTGLIASPGFIDPHSHADMTIFSYPLAENLIMQGITTFVGGNCGQTPAPVVDRQAAQKMLEADGIKIKIDWSTFAEWLSWLERETISLNYAPLTGHNTIRAAAMGEDFKRHATAAEIGTMRKHVDEGMNAGAFGLSTFFDPSPAEYCSLEEIVELSKVAAKYGGTFYPHTRHIQSQWPSDDPNEYGYGIYHGPIEDVYVGRYRGYLEAIEIARRARVPLHIAHLSGAFIIPPPHPGDLDAANARATLAIIDRAREEGIDVTFDTIPCTSTIAGQAPLIGAFARWVTQMGKDKFLAEINSKTLRGDIKKVRDVGRLKVGMVHTKADPYWSDCFTILTCKDKSVEGKTVSQLGAIRRADPLDVLMDILAADASTTWAQTMDKRMMEEGLPVLLQSKVAMPCTDVGSMPAKFKKGQGESPHGNTPPAIAYGLYPHYFSTYVREKGALSLEDAVMKASYAPAQLLRLKDRGVVKAGAYADIVLFDIKTIRMKGTLIDPAMPPEGISAVLVNGAVVYQNGKHTGARPGKVLRRA